MLTPKSSFPLASGYINELIIWNSGNLEVESSYVLRPLKINFSDSQKLMHVALFNLGKNEVDFIEDPNSITINFSKLLAKAGVKIYYFSKDIVSRPAIEGLIADPLRGAVGVTDATLFGSSNARPKFRNWYLNIAFTIFAIIGLWVFSSFLFLIEPASIFWKFAKFIIGYPLAAGGAILCTAYIYDNLIVLPPI